MNKSKAKPLLEDLYGDFSIDYNLTKCREKDTILKLLENHTPKHINKINTNGSYWDIDDASIYHFAINKSAVEINDISASITDFYDFLEQLVFYDNKPLYACFDDEGFIMVITAIPVDNKNIRFTIFPYNYNNKKRIEEDFIIEKYTFIKQIRDVIKRCYKILQLDNNEHYHALYTINSTEDALKFLDCYLKNPNDFKKTYNIPYHIRLFDIAYKKPNSDWKFTHCFDDDDRCCRDYWEEQIKIGKIEKYDIQEQSILMNKPFYHYTQDGHETRYYKTKDDIIYEADMDKRKDYKDWIFSEYTNKWYSGDEIQPKPPIEQTLLEDFKLNITINTDISSKWNNLETYIYGDNCWKKLVQFIVIIQKNDFKFEYEFNYSILTEKFLSNLERGRNITLDYKRECADLWNDEKEYFSFYYNYDDKKYFLKIKKSEFITKFRDELKCIDSEIEEYKQKKQLLLERIKTLGFSEKEFKKEYESLIYSNNEDIFSSREFEKQLIERIEKSRLKNKNRELLYEYNVMYKTTDNKWVLVTEFDRTKTAVNLKKKWNDKIKNGEISDFKYIRLDERPYTICMNELEKYIPTQYLWFSRNWVLSQDGSWLSKNIIMPEPDTESKLAASIKEFSFEINYLKRIDKYREFLNKVSKGKDFHIAICADIFHVYNKENGLIRIYLEKYEFRYRENTKPKVFDITIKKDIFIKEFKQMLDELD